MHPRQSLIHWTATIIVSLGCTGCTNGDLRATPTSPAASAALATASFPQTPDVDAYIDAIRGGDGDVLATHQAVADRYFEAGGPTVQESQPPNATPDMPRLATAASASDASARRRAMDELTSNAHRGGAVTAEVIREGLSDDDIQVRSSAMEAALGVAYQHRIEAASGPSDAYPWATDVLLCDALVARFDDSEASIAADAVEAARLLCAPSERVESAARAFYATGSDPVTRAAVLYLVADHGYASDTIVDLVVGAREDGAAEVRSAAAMAIAQCGVPDAARLLRAMLEVEVDPVARRAIEHAQSMLQP